MMYTGEEYQYKGKPKKSKPSTNGNKDPWEKPGFWLEPLNQFWEHGNYSEVGKEYCRKELLKPVHESLTYKMDLIGPKYTRNER